MNVDPWVIRTVLSPTSPLFREARYLLADEPDLERLRRIRALLTAQGRHGAGTAKLVCFSGSGFTEELTTAATTGSDTVLIGPGTLYQRP